MAQRNTAAVRPQGFEPVKGGVTLLDVFLIFLFDVIFEESSNRYRARKTAEKKVHKV